MSKMRLDVYLQNQGLAQSRTHAQELIKAEQVKLDGKICLKSSAPVEEGSRVEVLAGEANRFVSRGGLKLEGAIKSLQLSVQNLKALDVGISTGGFTDCLLKHGVQSVVGVDVGHGQVHPSLLADSRLKVHEGVNARHLSQCEFLPKQGFDLIVMDVSFISICMIIPELFSFLRPGGVLLSLVKPQFEVGPENISKSGMVKDSSLYKDVKHKVIEISQKSGFTVKDYIPSPIEGKDGNKEFFIYCLKSEEL